MKELFAHLLRKNFLFSDYSASIVQLLSVIIRSPAAVTMTECMTYHNPQNFACMIANINKELKDKGET